MPHEEIQDYIGKEVKVILTTGKTIIGILTGGKSKSENDLEYPHLSDCSTKVFVGTLPPIFSKIISRSLSNPEYFVAVVGVLQQS